MDGPIMRVQWMVWAFAIKATDVGAIRHDTVDSASPLRAESAEMPSSHALDASDTEKSSVY